ncbi:hypothetical protein Halha_0335 [Halobacteroides halobius DSM 5150]|uniref:Uncharacterized protein n=1 Tax=Halobacteroides halobius (strain ATCC 35273 / DSM 5150 / MD-1) TaxID=748449 RepID=L0K7M5_HALHC|nr:hypothetical protein [Halobacteroides halobius]AGB40344.1 hypothetical protein Halha_0335 [Halobacteroides halobius DSM 5150]
MGFKKYEMGRFYKLFHYFLKIWILFVLSVVWFIVLTGEPNLDNSIFVFIEGAIISFIVHVIGFYYIFKVPISILIKEDKIKFNLLFGWGKEFDKEDIHKCSFSKNFLGEDIRFLIKVKGKMIKYRILVKCYSEKNYKKLKEEITKLTKNIKTINSNNNDLKNISSLDLELNNKMAYKIIILYFIASLPYFIVNFYFKMITLIIVGVIFSLTIFYSIFSRVADKVKFINGNIVFKSIIKTYELKECDTLIKLTKFFNKDVIILINDNFGFLKYFLVFIEDENKLDKIKNSK